MNLLSTQHALQCHSMLNNLKQMQTMKQKTKKMLIEWAKELLKATIVFLAAMLGLESCGVTSARISRPAEGTTTTVTITTNNPMSTTVNPNTQGTVNWKPNNNNE